LGDVRFVAFTPHIYCAFVTPNAPEQIYLSIYNDYPLLSSHYDHDTTHGLQKSMANQFVS
jgi:hypothetical protein